MTLRERINYDVRLFLRDMALKGWTASDLAGKAKPAVAISSVTRFLNGDHQTAKMAKRMAKALGRSVRRYMTAPKPALGRTVGAGHSAERLS